MDEGYEQESDERGVWLHNPKRPEGTYDGIFGRSAVFDLLESVAASLRLTVGVTRGSSESGDRIWV